MNKYLYGYIFVIIAVISTVGFTFYYVDAQIRTITVDNSNRREYTYCPINDQLAKTNISVEGCPLVRVYVNNWSQLTSLQQTTIDTQIRGLGFVDAGEHIIR